MTYEEFKNVYTFNDVRTKKLNKRFSKKVEDDLIKLLYMIKPWLDVEVPSDALSTDDLTLTIQEVFNKLKEEFEHDKANRILSYEDFKSMSVYDWGDQCNRRFNLELYTEDESTDLFRWSLKFEEELYQARMHDRIITGGPLEPPDKLTEEEEHVPMQQLIDEAKSKWTV